MLLGVSTGPDFHFLRSRGPEGVALMRFNLLAVGLARFLMTK